MEKRTRIIEEKLADIFRELNEVRLTKSLSLMTGNAGCVLYKALYLKYSRSSEVADSLGSDIQFIAENAYGGRATFCTGRSGISWFFKYLFFIGILSKEDSDFLSEDDEELVDHGLQMIRVGNYDFLHGSIGIFYSLLYQGATGFGNQIDNFIDALEVSMGNGVPGNMMPYYNTMDQCIVLDKVNMSLSHGITSILGFCLECCRQGISVKKSEKLARNIIAFMIANTNQEKRKSYFPSFVHTSNVPSDHSRLAWCYGDLSIAYMLLQAAIVFGDLDLRNFAMEVIRHAANRKSYEETIVADAGICHGTAGIAHIFNKVWNLTSEVEYKRTSEYWIDRTLSFSVHTDTISGYKKFNGITEKYEPDTGFLEGTAGIGLVLLSQLTGDFSWDYCLMLNN